VDFDQHCTEIVNQTEQLTLDVEGADLRSPVPSCPGWSLGMLLRHIGGGHRWAEEIVRTRATGFLPDDQVRKLDGDDSSHPPVGWLLEGATKLVDTLRAAGPDAQMWVAFHYRTAAFWARRFAHETLIHRADAALAVGAEFTVATDVALDAVDEWMELDALPQLLDLKPSKRELLGPGRTLALQATDARVDWFGDLTGEVISWRRGEGPATVVVRARLTDLLLLLYRRKAPDAGEFEISGDRQLLDFWLTHVAFA
jgi:uncharacterized protein (TIGR03083 family)